MGLNKKWVWNTISFFSFFTILILIFNFIVDPLHFYRTNQTKSLYWGEQRWQLAGLAKNYNYNTIILGTSMTENFIASEVNNFITGAKTLKLSMSDSSPFEQNQIAQISFSKKKIKNVIWGIDYTSLSREEDFVKEEFPAFLYDKIEVNDIHYLLNITTIKYSIATLVFNRSPEVAKLSSIFMNLNDQPIEDINYLNYWGDLAKYNKELVIKDFFQKIKEDKINKEELLKTLSFNNFKKNIDKNVLPVVKNHPETQFYFYYPPYSILMNKRFDRINPTIIDDIIKSREYFYSQIKMYPNVKLYDFTTEKEITYDLDNYKDVMHHNPEINKYILKSFNNNKYLVVDNNLYSFLDDFKNQIKEYSIEQINTVKK